MILTALSFKSLQECNKINLSSVTVSEKLSFLENSIHFHPGSWYQPMLKITDLHITYDVVQKIHSWQSNNTRNYSRCLLRWIGSVSLILQVDVETLKLKSLNDQVKINHVPVQVGLSTIEDPKVVIYLSPLDVYLKIQDKYKSLLAIQTLNSRESIVNSALETITDDYKNLLDKIDKEIENRIEHND